MDASQPAASTPIEHRSRRARPRRVRRGDTVTIRRHGFVVAVTWSDQMRRTPVEVAREPSTVGSS
jgi:hypothetical protein